MLREAFSLLALSSTFAFALSASDDAARAALAGTWTSQGDAAKDGASTWVFEPKGDAIKVTHTEGASTVSEYECNTMGQGCKIKEGGKRATVSLWFNGGKLVELETQGSEVTKRRFAVNENGEEMDLELIPISAGGKPETIHLKRLQVTASGK